jgi:hypothetical protein
MVTIAAPNPDDKWAKFPTSAMQATSFAYAENIV